MYLQIEAVRKMSTKVDIEQMKSKNMVLCKGVKMMKYRIVDADRLYFSQKDKEKQLKLEKESRYG